MVDPVVGDTVEHHNHQTENKLGPVVQESRKQPDTVRRLNAYLQYNQRLEMLAKVHLTDVDPAHLKPDPSKTWKPDSDPT